MSAGTTGGPWDILFLHGEGAERQAEHSKTGIPMPGMDVSYSADAESWTAHFVPSFHPLSVMLWGRGPPGEIQVAILVAGGSRYQGSGYLPTSMNTLEYFNN